MVGNTNLGNIFCFINIFRSFAALRMTDELKIFRCAQDDRSLKILRFAQDDICAQNDRCAQDDRGWLRRGNRC